MQPLLSSHTTPTHLEPLPTLPAQSCSLTTACPHPCSYSYGQGNGSRHLQPQQLGPTHQAPTAKQSVPGGKSTLPPHAWNGTPIERQRSSPRRFSSWWVLLVYIWQRSLFSDACRFPGWPVCLWVWVGCVGCAVCMSIWGNDALRITQRLCLLVACVRLRPHCGLLVPDLSTRSLPLLTAHRAWRMQG